MDRLIAEPQTETQKQEAKAEVVEKEVVQNTQTQPQSKESTAQDVLSKPDSLENETKQENINSAYLNSFENLTVADIKREEERKEAEAFKAEKAQLLERQFEPVEKESNIEKSALQEEETSKKQEAESVNIIEKPNYDLIEDKKIVKIHAKKSAKKPAKKAAAVALACTLGAAALVCVVNTIVIDQMSSSYVQIDETYNFNLRKYLNSLNNLDSTKKSMEFVETYPEQQQDAGEIGEKSNWFDRVCKFLGGLFGG